MAADYQAKYEALRRAFIEILELDQDADVLAWFINAKQREKEASERLSEVNDAKYWKRKYEEALADSKVEAELRQITQDEFARYRREHE